MSKIGMIKNAQQSDSIFVLTETVLFELIGDKESTTVFTESVVKLLGHIVGKINAGQSPMQSLDARAQQLLVRMVAGAKVLKDSPDTVKALNMNANSLKDIMLRVGQSDANTKLASIGDNAPQVEKQVQQMFNDYQRALTSGDQKQVSVLKRDIGLLWQFWQQQLNRMQSAGTQQKGSVQAPQQRGSVQAPQQNKQQGRVQAAPQKPEFNPQSPTPRT